MEICMETFRMSEYTTAPSVYSIGSNSSNNTPTYISIPSAPACILYLMRNRTMHSSWITLRTRSVLMDLA